MSIYHSMELCEKWQGGDMNIGPLVNWTIGKVYILVAPNPGSCVWQARPTLSTALVSGTVEIQPTDWSSIQMVKCRQWMVCYTNNSLVIGPVFKYNLNSGQPLEWLTFGYLTCTCRLFESPLCTSLLYSNTVRILNLDLSGFLMVEKRKVMQIVWILYGNWNLDA